MIAEVSVHGGRAALLLVCAESMCRDGRVLANTDSHFVTIRKQRGEMGNDQGQDAASRGVP